MSPHIITSNREAAILARMIQSDDCQLTPDAARYLLSMKLAAGDEHRVNQLSAKASEGSLTAGETKALDGYVHIESLLAIMQSKARLLPKRTPASQQ